MTSDQVSVDQNPAAAYSRTEVGRDRQCGKGGVSASLTPTPCLVQSSSLCYTNYEVHYRGTLGLKRVIKAEIGNTLALRTSGIASAS